MLSGGDVFVQWAVSGDSSAVDHVHIRIDESPPISSHELAGSYTFANITSGPHTVTAQLAAADHSNFQNPEATATAAFQMQLASPALSAVPTNLDFGFAAVGVATAEMALSLQNTGQVPLTISALTLAGAHATDFALKAPAIQLVIPVGQERAVGVTFTPSATGNRLASVNITADELAAPLSIPLAGVGYTTSTGGALLYRINCAGPSYTDPDGNTWSPDTGYFNTGKVSSTSANIAGTELDTLYRTERYDSATAPEMVYSFPLANGAYRVKLHFAETYSPLFLAGRRVFDVAAEGAVVLDDLDIFARVGGNTALIETVDVNVADGALNVEFRHGIENPKINAIEIAELSGGGSLLASPASLQWGHVALGQAGDVRNVQLFNSGSDVAVISALTFHINAGAGHEFRAGLGGTEYVGDHEDVTFPLNVAVGPGQSLIVPVTFAPTEAGQHDISLEFAGNFPMQSVRLIGIGGANPGHPFLHVVITVPDVTVDYDQNGVEPVMLDGADSHTHELGRVLTAFEWREGGQLLSTQVSPTLNFGFGEHTVSLTIRDDNLPPESLTDTASFKVVGPNQVPGALALYYPAGGGGAAALLDNVPANASYAEIVSPLRITANGSLIGGSPYSANIMARLVAQIDILVNDTYSFVASGGSARRLLIDGTAVSGPVSLSAGRHSLEARFAVSSANDLPLGITYARGSAAQADVPAGLLTHDQTAVRPVINSMPTGGSAAGGEQVEIKGLGFFPANQVQVNWGGQLLSGLQLTVAPNSIRLTAPPGAGTQNVTVQTPNGVSNAASYAYSSTGPAPVVFTLADLTAGINGPTTADWGSDGRLYVGTIDGVIKAYTFDDNYAVTATQTINTIAALANKNILGIAANPLDAPGPVKIYVAHSLIYANGGACFTGSSPYSGQVSVLTGPNFNTVQPLITSLPVSNHDHAINGLQFDDRGDLYICIGGNTNAGVEHCNLGALPESPFTAAIIKAAISKPNFNGAITYLLTATGQANTDQVAGGVVDVAPGVDLSVFASGLRNPYDLVYTTNGRIYATDNGPNGGFGAASTSATTQTNDPTAGDELNLIEQNLYYGHPNRNRGRYDDRQNVYRNSSIASIPGVFNQMLTNFAASTNGIVEYRANTFNGAMRGDLLAQKWNGQTYRVTLSADGRSVLNKQNLPVNMNSLDVVTGPGGVVIGIDYTGNKLSIARPQHTPGPAVYDVFPWRAPESGGGAFVIGGNGFGILGNTTVTFGGVPATLTSVTATRIRGTIPARLDAPADMVDLVVTVGATSATLPSAFRYLPAQTAAGAGAEATVTVDPGGTIGNSSTYTPGAFEIRNDSTGGKRIARVRFDLSTAILRDLVFDPNGDAGDTAFKVFSPNQQGGAGLVAHAYGRAHDGGFDELLIDFADFDPGETFTFSIDVDPTSIRGAPPGGAQDEGAISGIEMAGTRVTIAFSDGSVRSGDLFPIAGSATGSAVRIGPVLPAPVNIQVSGAPVSPATVAGAGRTVRVTGAPGAAVRLMVAEGGLYLTNVPGGGFDLDAYETNKLVAVAHYFATLNAAGHADIPVTLTRLGAGAGFNHVAAVAVDGTGRTSPLSNVPMVLLNP
ncbi:MAG: choice-of-anchor D domain-containing protein [Planctomycetes bacterium]|nr:choice-of-anchor D domain-containing protein [Planctomycetota bacterium]